VLAACGTPLVAARGGKVLGAGYGGGGGNYVAIPAAGSSCDYVYMHLRDTPLVKEGKRVYTGQPIGFVGRTGDASACHLHFELWQGPWFSGGRTVDPLTTLRGWDRLS
jgi:murein DD-endopeptidase MepM/ murein hydrolase activator NlpD